MSKMTEERLMLGKKIAVTTRKRQAAGHSVPIHAAVLADFVEDNDRLRAENERLRVLLAECAQYLGHKGTNANAYDLFIRAGLALSPEATE